MTRAQRGANEVRLSGLSQPEGPVSLTDGSLALVEMGEDHESVTILLASGVRKVLPQPGGRPTGLAMDGDGCFWLAGGPGNSLVRLSPEGSLLATVNGDDHGPFLFPNDLAFGPDGLLYLTDSGMLPREFISGLSIRPDFQTAHYEGRVVRIDPVAARVTDEIASDLRFANGIAFDRNGSLFYNEMLTGIIYVKEEGRPPERFANVLKPSAQGQFRGPDGMAFDVEGSLYCAVYGQKEIAVVASSGRVLPAIPTDGDRPTNVAFSLTEPLLFVTEAQRGCIEEVPMSVSGLPLHRPMVGR